MELFLMLLIVSIIMGIIAGIRRLTYTAKGKEWRDAKPIGNPLSSGPLIKKQVEGSVKWMACKRSYNDYWSLVITDKDAPFDIDPSLMFYQSRLGYCLNFISSWDNLIKARDFLLEKVQGLNEQKEWELIEPPDWIMENKETRIIGVAKSGVSWEVWKKSGKWYIELQKPKRGFFSSGYQWKKEAQADQFEEIIEKKNNLIRIEN